MKSSDLWAIVRLFTRYLVHVCMSVDMYAKVNSIVKKNDPKTSSVTQ